MPDLRTAALMRLIWIDAALVIPGRLNRADVCAAFAISVPQVATDLRVFQAAFPGRAVYDPRRRVYLPAPGSQPVYTTETRQAVVRAVQVMTAVRLRHD